MRVFIYSLRTLSGRPVLDYSLGLHVSYPNQYQISIQLPTGLVTLNKSEYLNKMKIYDDGVKIFFYVCTKKVSAKFVFKKLLEYSVFKIDNRIEHLQALKNDYEKVLAA